MSTSILNAPPVDPRDERRRKMIIAGIVGGILLITAYVVVGLLVFGYVGYPFRFWQERRVVNNFFTALEAKNYEQAYGVWMADPNWRQHPNQHPRYRFGDFYLDWGPGGEYGLIKSHHIDGCGSKWGSSGVVVVVTVNERVEPKARLWVEKSDKTMSYSPY